MRFEHITLATSLLSETRQFYGTVLGLPVISSEEDSFSIKVGSTTMTFEQTSSETQPFYHFAFDIPANQFHEAKAWLEQHVSLSRDQGNDSVYFSSLDASSIYFEDPAGNIVEWICRFSYSPKNPNLFHPHSLQCVSEMSVVVADKALAAQQLIEHGIPSRDSEPVPEDGLTFMGIPKEAVYFLLVPEGRTWYFSTQAAKIHPSRVVLEDGRVIETTRDGTLICSVK